MENPHDASGWKYEHAFESSQKYKEGKFIIELAHMIKENGWEKESWSGFFILHISHQCHQQYSLYLLLSSSSTSCSSVSLWSKSKILFKSLWNPFSIPAPSHDHSSDHTHLMTTAPIRPISWPQLRSDPSHDHSSDHTNRKLKRNQQQKTVF